MRVSEYFSRARLHTSKRTSLSDSSSSATMRYVPYSCEMFSVRICPPVRCVTCTHVHASRSELTRSLPPPLKATRVVNSTKVVRVRRRPYAAARARVDQRAKTACVQERTFPLSVTRARGGVGMGYFRSICTPPPHSPGAVLVSGRRPNDVARERTGDRARTHPVGEGLAVAMPRIPTRLALRQQQRLWVPERVANRVANAPRQPFGCKRRQRQRSPSTRVQHGGRVT